MTARALYLVRDHASRLHTAHGNATVSSCGRQVVTICAYKPVPLYVARDQIRREHGCIDCFRKVAA